MSQKPLDPELVRIVKPIVTGHTRALVNKLHPSWFPKKVRAAIIDSLAKRIVNDICCELNSSRIKTSVSDPADRSSRRAEPAEQDVGVIVCKDGDY